MEESRKLTLVLTRNDANKRAWEVAFPYHPVIVLREVELLREVLLSEGIRSRGEIARIVFDDGGEPLDFLNFLCTVPMEYRGDVLFIGCGGSGYLSAIHTRGEGRMLYAVTPDDVAFYLHINFDDIRRCEPTCRIEAA